MDAKRYKFAVTTAIAFLLLVLPLLLSSAVRSFFLSHPGVILVAVAVAGEVVCDWKWEHGWREKLKIGFGLLLVMGLIVEIFEAVHADKELADSRERAARNEMQAEQNRKDAALANERAGLANSNAAFFALKLKELSSGVFVISNALPPRLWTNQWSSLSKLIKFQSISVSVVVSRSGEAERLATNILSRLHDAGWKTNQPPIQVPILQYGISIACNVTARGMAELELQYNKAKDPTATSRYTNAASAARVLQAEFRAAGFTSTLDDVYLVPPNCVVIRIGENPYPGYNPNSWQMKDGEVVHVWRP